MNEVFIVGDTTQYYPSIEQFSNLEEAEKEYHSRSVEQNPGGKGYSTVYLAKVIRLKTVKESF